jgi:hypothetical protein
MSINKYKSHIFVLPEDDANREIANGFILNENINNKTIQILPSAGGWKRVLEKFMDDYVSTMRKFPQRMIVLVIDFDGDYENRWNYVKEQIPEDLKNRVFVIGAQSEPENLKKDMNTNFEGIGEALAKDCSDKTDKNWGHALLKHNKTEIDRMILSVKPYLFCNTPDGF